jgi:hypothetical protein
LRQTAAELGLGSSTTLARWAAQTDAQLTSEPFGSRRNHIPLEQCNLLAGACFWLCQAGAPLHYSTIHDLSMDMLGRDVDHNWVYRFCRESSLTRHRARPRAPGAFGPDSVDQCVAFLQALRDETSDPAHLYAMDEKGVWDNAHPEYTLAPRGRFDEVAPGQIRAFLAADPGYTNPVFSRCPM